MTNPMTATRPAHTAAVSVCMTGKATGTGKVSAAPTPTPNRTLKAQVSTVGATPETVATLGAVRRGASAVRLQASSGAVKWAEVRHWRIEKVTENGKQTSVTLTDTRTGRIVREETRSTKDINAVFTFAVSASKLNDEKLEYENVRSIAIKAGDTARAELYALKLTGNASAYDAACLKAAIAGVMEVLPELTPRAPRRRHVAMVAPTL